MRTESFAPQFIPGGVARRAAKARATSDFQYCDTADIAWSHACAQFRLRIRRVSIELSHKRACVSQSNVSVRVLAGLIGVRTSLNATIKNRTKLGYFVRFMRVRVTECYLCNCIRIRVRVLVLVILLLTTRYQFQLHVSLNPGVLCVS